MQFSMYSFAQWKMFKDNKKIGIIGGNVKLFIQLSIFFGISTVPLERPQVKVHIYMCNGLEIGVSLLCCLL